MKQTGFTLIELILVVTILAIVGALSVPFLQSYQLSSDVESYTQTTLGVLRRAQHNAAVGRSSGSWGVHIDDTAKTLTLFLGSSFASRDVEFDLATQYSPALSVTADFGQDIVFEIFSGVPQQTGTVTVTGQAGEPQTITVAASGVIESSN